MLSHPLVIFIALVILLGMSAFFSGSETALMAISKLRLQHLAETSPVRARLIERILKNPERLIGTILLGNNLVNVTMSALATVLALSLWGEKGIVYVIAVLTLAILIFAEITPKVYAKYFYERVSMVASPVQKIIRPPYFIPADKKIDSQLRSFQEKNSIKRLFSMEAVT